MILIFSFNVHTFQNQQRPKRQPQLPAKYKEDSGKAGPSNKIRKKQPVAKEQQKSPSREDMLLLLQASMESSDPQVNVEFPPNPLLQNRSPTSNNPKPSSAASTPLSIPIPTPTLQVPPPQQDSIAILLHLVQQLGQRIEAILRVEAVSFLEGTGLSGVQVNWRSHRMRFQCYGHRFGSRRAV
ncbi:uncharacterized protein LOC143219401 [Lasioglossum baleicum]|uniref:uncharacterized protein LOC143219401 n=1 Tax=Lasioglossum baleicum TaxID=434251 RepID=UPI003FCE0225